MPPEIGDTQDQDQLQDDSSPRLPLRFRQLASAANGIPVADVPQGAPQQAPTQFASAADAPPSIASVTPPSTTPPRLISTGLNDPNRIPSPGPSTTAALDPLMKRRAELLSPDVTKTHPEFKMPLWQRIVGSAANFARGFGGYRGEPIYVGPGATNRRYGQAVEQTNQQIADTEKIGGINQKLYEDAIKQAYESQVGEARQRTAEAQGERSKAYGEIADVKGQLVSAQQDALSAKAERDRAAAGKSEDPIGQRIKEADRIGLKGEERKYYLANGKLKEATDRQPTELEEWRAAFRQQYGREPNADEIANRKSRNASKADQIEKDKETELSKAEDKATKRIEKAQQLYKFQPKQLEAEKQAAYADLEKDKQRIQSSYETRATQNAQNARPAAPAPARPAPAQARTAPAPAAKQPKIDPSAKPVQTMNGRKVGDIVKLRDGSSAKITQLYDNGQFTYDKTSPTAK